MKMRSSIFAGAVSTIAIVAAVAFYGYYEPSSENKVRVAFFPNVGHVVPIVGIERGVFSEGLENQAIIETKLFDSGPQVIESLFANSIDLAYVGPVPAINGFLKSGKNPLKILAGAASGGASFVIHPESSITSAQDLAGKRIASPQIGNSQDVSLRHYLSENGIKSAEKGGSVFVLNLANPDIYTLFTKGDIDAAWVSEPWATILVQELGGKRLFYEEQLWPNNQFATVLLVARGDYIEKNPQVIQSWIDSHIETVNWINENPRETETIFNMFMDKTFGQSLPDEIVKESLSNIKITADPIPDSIDIFAQRADSLGYLGRHGYSLDGIFYTADVNPKEKEAI